MGADDTSKSDAASSAASVARKIRQLMVELPEDRADAARLDELRRIFAKLLQEGEFDVSATKQPSPSTTHNSSLASAKWRAFLHRSHNKMVQQLVKGIIQGKRTAIRTLWGVVATSPRKSVKGEYEIVDEGLLLRWVQAMSKIPVWDKSVHHMVEAEFFHPYRDIQYFSMVAIRSVADEMYSTNTQSQARAERLLQLLMLIPLATSQRDIDEHPEAFMFPIPDNIIPDEEADDEASSASGDNDNDVDDDDDEASSGEDGSSEEEDEEESKRTEPQSKRQRQSRPQLNFERSAAHAKMWSRAWLAVLRLELPTSSLKQALQYLPTNVLPYVKNPLFFSGFFIQAYQHSGVLPILALDGLFALMTQHGLEYQDYYKQLYKLVSPTLFYVRYRTRFFRLLDRSISRNELLPAQTVAAFLKRLLRSCMHAPPAGILTALAMASNWLRKHAETTVMVHAVSTSPVDDPYDAATDDPSASKAIQSSLWELQALSQHYYPSVVTLAAAVGSPEQDKAPLLDMEDFYEQSYHNLFEQERKRQRKSKQTPLTFVPPKSLFAPSDALGGIIDIPETVPVNEGSA